MAKVGGGRKLSENDQRETVPYNLGQNSCADFLHVPPSSPQPSVVIIVFTFQTLSTESNGILVYCRNHSVMR